MTKAQRDIRRKLRILTYAREIGNISKACRYFGISREGFYRWKRAYAASGEEGLINSKPCPENPSLRIPGEIEEKILYLRKTYHLGQLRIFWFLERYHGIKVSSRGVYQVLKRNGMNRLPRNAKTRTVLTQRYEKQVPGHQIQVDVKFLNFIRADRKKIYRFQYTAVDDATRIRALKIYPRHTQENAIVSSTMWFQNSLSESIPFGQTTVMSFKPSFIGMWRIWESAISIIGLGLQRLTGRWSVPMQPMT